MKLYQMFVLIILLILAGATVTSAQNRFSVNGRIQDEISRVGLAGANVVVQNTTLGTTTDEDGYFRLPQLPAGSYKLEASYMGYARRSIVLEVTRDTSLTISLGQKPISGPIVSVTATRARERRSAVTFSSIEREEISNRYTIQDIPEVVSDLPSTTFYSESGAGLGYNYLSIRGFDQRRISVMINGIPQNDPEDHNVYWVDFPDFTANVQSIQVQRGAGSAFYGPAAIGGSINILTNYFSPQRQAKAFYGLGSFNTKKYSVSYNTGLLKDRFVIYGRASRITTDGYRDRAWIDFFSYFLGAAFYWQKSNLRLQFYGGPIEDGLVYKGLPKIVNDDDKLRLKNYSYWGYNENRDSIAYAAERRADEIENFNQPHFELIHEYKIKHNLTLNNSAFFIRGYGFFDYDGSWGTPEYYRLTPQYGYRDITIPSDALIRAYVDNKQVGWLPQLLWSGSWGELVVGAELRYHRSLHWGRLQKGSGLPAGLAGNSGRRYYQYKGGKDIASIYVHQTSKIMPRVYLMSDLQYAYKKYRLYDEKYLDTNFEVPYHFLNPRIGLNFNYNSKINFYASLSNTTREPRLKNLYDAAEASTPADWGAVVPQFAVNSEGRFNFSKPLVKPETLTGLEWGASYRSPGLKGSLNFYIMDFKDEIIKSGQLDRFGQPVTGNAERTRHRGVELTGEIQILPQVALSGNFLYGKNELIAYRTYVSGSSEDLSGNSIAGFPDMLANLRLTYAWKGLYAALAMRYQGAFYTDNFKNDERKLDAFTVYNLIVRYQLDQIGFKGLAFNLRVNNLLDKLYLAHGEGDDFFPAATRNWFLGLQYEM